MNAEVEALFQKSESSLSAARLLIEEGYPRLCSFKGILCDVLRRRGATFSSRYVVQHPRRRGRSFWARVCQKGEAGCQVPSVVDRRPGHPESRRLWGWEDRV
jgi:hypothetical protein